MTTQRQSTSGGLPSAIKPDDASVLRARSAWAWVVRVSLVAVGAVAASALGTALHGQSIDGFPLGALAALLLSGSIAVFVGACFRSVWPTAAAGVLTYVLTGLAATTGGASSLIVTGSSGINAAPIAVAGNLWIFGQAVVGILAVIVVALALRTRRKSSGA